MAGSWVINIVLMMVDALIVAISPALALMIRFDGIIPSNYFNIYFNVLSLVVALRIAVFYIFGLYRRLWRYASINELLAIVGAVTCSSLVIAMGMYFLYPHFPRSVIVISWFINILLVGASRFLIRVVSHMRQLKRLPDRDNVLIIGAGDAGAMIARELHQHFGHEKQIVGFIDDDKSKLNKTLYGVKVVGNMEKLPEILSHYAVDEIIIAMPSVGGDVIAKYVTLCKKHCCSIKILPNVYELIDGQVTLKELREVQLEDLLRREPVELDTNEIAKYLTGKTVLVTGAGGSIGSELCRQIGYIKPALLVLLGRGENSIFEIHNELKQHFPNLQIEALIGDVRDKQTVANVFEQYHPQVVFHAAAHKHVPLMEKSPQEAVKNNIFGTQNVAEAADRFKSEAFILISTDKAVNPTSVMGATKRVAELIIQNINRHSDTRFAAVRFGNVLGSRGSVIPTFKRQIAQGGPITVTHPEMKRYFMTIPEAVQLVIQAGSMTNGGEVFVLDMGEPVKIVDMARDLIELSGLKIDKDIKIEFVGLRPGEKLFEELLTAEEGTRSTKHQKIYIANLREVDEKKLHTSLMKLKNSNRTEQAVKELEKLLPTYEIARRKYGCDTQKIVIERGIQTDDNSIRYQPASSLR